MWEQIDRGRHPSGGTTAGTALVNQTKTNGVIFRQLGRRGGHPARRLAEVQLAGPEPGDQQPDARVPGHGADPGRQHERRDRPVPDARRRTGHGSGARPASASRSGCRRRDWVGFLSDRTMTFRLTARDGKMGGGGIGFAETKVTVAPLAGPFRVTSQSVPQVIHGTTLQNITWDVAGTNASPINVANVKITLSTDGGVTFATVLAESTPNDGSFAVNMPDVNAERARIKVEAIGNVFFDVSHADFTLVKAATQTVARHGAGHAVADARRAGELRGVHPGRRRATTTRPRRPTSSRPPVTPRCRWPTRARTPGPPRQRLVRDAVGAAGAGRHDRRVLAGQRRSGDAEELQRADLQRRGDARASASTSAPTTRCGRARTRRR